MGLEASKICVLRLLTVLSAVEIIRYTQYPGTVIVQAPVVHSLPGPIRYHTCSTVKANAAITPATTVLLVVDKKCSSS